MFKRLFGFIHSSTVAESQEPENYGEAPQELPEGEADEEPEKAQAAWPSTPVDTEALDTFFPINAIGKDKCLTYVQDPHTWAMGPGSVLFEQGRPIESLYYLLEGSVSLYVYDDKIGDINADGNKLKYPLCSGKQFSVTARATTDIQFLRVAPELIAEHYSSEATTFNPEDPNIPDFLQESQLFQTFCRAYRNGDLVIPTLPSITFQLRHALEAKGGGVNEVAEIVQMDPAIAGKLVQIANSVLYHPWKPFTNCKDAISHIGLKATRNFVLIQSLRQIFNCRNPRLNQLLKEEWRKSIYLSSLCWVLATEDGGVNAEEAQLAGLVSEIGSIPFLTSLAQLPQEQLTPHDIALAIPYVAPKIGMEVLKNWGFSDELAEIPLISENYFNDTCPHLKLSDIVILSKLHSHMGTPKMSSLPPINSIPAFGKLKDHHLCSDDPMNFSLQVLSSAKEKVKAAESLLGF